MVESMVPAAPDRLRGLDDLTSYPHIYGMARLDAYAVAILLRELGQRAILAGGNPYRARAYLKAAESLSALTVPLDTVVSKGELRQIPGVGETIADIVEKLHLTGTHPGLEKMRQDIPAGVLEMLAVPGLRPERVLKLYRELGIASLDELEAAAKADRLSGVKGFGPSFQRKVLTGLDISRRARGARHIHRAAALLASAEKDLAGTGLTDITPAGDYRRGCELITDLSIVACAQDKTGPKMLKSGDLTVHITDKKRYGITLLLATGSEDHLEELRKLAKSKGMLLAADGLTRKGKIIASDTEESIYSAVGLSVIPPVLREGRGEVAIARAGKHPRLVQQGDIQGILHAHTRASDGVNTLEEMAEATRKRGYSYFGVADHSQSAHYAGGLSIEEIDDQHKEIDRLNVAYGGTFRMFKGIESDILPEGSLDYADDILARFDFVVASVHSRFRLDKDAQTQRILRAVANPYTTILGHPMGRQLLRRPGYEFDIERVLRACAKHRVAVEINANPWRLDLDWRWHGRALELGCIFSINPDAHSTSELDLMQWGVLIARKGGVPRERVLNCRGPRAIAGFFERAGK
jgi:DNA polymerase (family 10)